MNTKYGGDYGDILHLLTGECGARGRFSTSCLDPVLASRQEGATLGDVDLFVFRVDVDQALGNENPAFFSKASCGV